MRILLTNDDGINAPGLYVLEKIAAKLSDDIWICAPSEEQSGAGHSLTLTRPVRLREHAPRRFSVSGTPTDSVTMALRKVMPGPPDLILSGVNRGANLGDDVTYSGTVSAALEGALAGIRSIALSQVYSREGMGESVPFACAESWGEKVLRKLLALPHDPRMLVNVNFPPIAPEEVNGIRVARQGFHEPGYTRVVESTDPRGFRYYWFGMGTSSQGTEGSDIKAIRDGCIAVTPLHFDLTHDASMATLAEAFR